MAFGCAGSRVARCEVDVGLGEADRPSAVERSGSPSSHPDQAERTASGSTVSGSSPCRPSDHRVGRAVPDPRRSERSVERARHALDLIEQAVLAKTGREVAGRPHGADRVGARGSYADGEQLERRDVGAHRLRLRRSGAWCVPLHGNDTHIALCNLVRRHTMRAVEAQMCAMVPSGGSSPAGAPGHPRLTSAHFPGES